MGEWTAQRPKVKAVVVRSLGDLPPRPSTLKVRTIRIDRRDGYTVEKFVFDNGRLVNNSFTDYKIPTAKDIPAEMVQFFVETPHPQGPYGARGVAEHPMISVPGAVGNALANATGVEFFELPLDPERVYLTLKRAAEKRAGERAPAGAAAR